MSEIKENSLDKRAADTVRALPINLWAWYEVAKSLGAKEESELTAVANGLGIQLTRDVETAISEGFNEYNWDRG